MRRQMMTTMYVEKYVSPFKCLIFLVGLHDRAIYPGAVIFTL